MVDLDFLLGPLGSKDRRREGRQAAHGTVRIGGRTYELIDWSSSGFRAEGAVEVSNEPDRVPIEFTITSSNAMRSSSGLILRRRALPVFSSIWTSATVWPWPSTSRKTPKTIRIKELF